MQDERLLGNVLMLHKNLPRGSAFAFKNAKLVRPAKGCRRSRVMVMLIPPFMVEHTRLKDGRTKTVITAYTATVDDISEVVKMPPPSVLQCRDGMARDLRQLALEYLAAMAMLKYPLSNNFLWQLAPKYHPIRETEPRKCGSSSTHAVVG